jgi:hypothetical protein
MNRFEANGLTNLAGAAMNAIEKKSWTKSKPIVSGRKDSRAGGSFRFPLPADALAFRFYMKLRSSFRIVKFKVTVHGAGRGRRRFSAKIIAMMEYLVPKTSSVPFNSDLRTLII